MSLDNQYHCATHERQNVLTNAANFYCQTEMEHRLLWQAGLYPTELNVEKRKTYQEARLDSPAVIKRANLLRYS